MSEERSLTERIKASAIEVNDWVTAALGACSINGIPLLRASITKRPPG